MVKSHGKTTGWMLEAMVPGIALTGALAAAAIGLAQLRFMQAAGFSPLTLAILLGMLAGNTLLGPGESRLTPGINFSKQRLLRAGIVFYGLRLTFQEIAHVGAAGLVIDLVMLSCTFGLAWWIGTRWLGIDRTTAMLIGAGSAICGAAAVLATDPVVRGRAEQVAVAISTVVVFGTSAIFIYPVLYHLNLTHPLVTMSSQAYGIFVGSTVHEVAQVVAAGRAVSAQAADTAVITKMVRVMLLAPFLLLLSAYLRRAADPAPHAADAAASADAGTVDATTAGAGVRGAAAQPPAKAGRPALAIPWFAIGFVAVAALHSIVPLPTRWVGAALDLDSVMLAMAMGALGLTTHVSAIGKAGVRPIALGALLFLWLIVGGAVVNTVLGHALA